MYFFHNLFIVWSYFSRGATAEMEKFFGVCVCVWEGDGLFDPKRVNLFKPGLKECRAE